MPQDPHLPELDQVASPDAFQARSRAMLGGILAIVLILLWVLLA